MDKEIIAFAYGLRHIINLYPSQDDYRKCDNRKEKTTKKNAKKE